MSNLTDHQAAILLAAIKLTHAKYPAIKAHVASGRGGTLRIDPRLGSTMEWIIEAGYWTDAITPELLLEYGELRRDTYAGLAQRLWHDSHPT